MRLAVLDANVLYPAHLRDVLLRLAAGGFFRPRWSARIHDEWTRNLLANRPDLSAEQLARTRALMERAFPDAGVAGYEAHEASLALPDPDDRHVVAAAVEAEAGEIVTANLRDFPDAALRPLGIEAVSPDAFVASMLEDDLAAVIAVMRRHREGLRRPPLDTGGVRRSPERGRPLECGRGASGTCGRALTGNPDPRDTAGARS